MGKVGHIIPFAATISLHQLFITFKSPVDLHLTARFGASNIKGGIIPLYNLENLSFSHQHPVHLIKADTTSPFLSNDVSEGSHHSSSCTGGIELLSSLDHVQGVE
jgi:hypothetical protein